MLLSLSGAAAGLQAWATLDESSGDVAGADAHRSLAEALSSAAARGVEQAFATHARALREAAPADLAPGLAGIDTAFAGWLGGDAEALFQAEEAWITEAMSDRLERLPTALRLSLLSDGVALHDAALVERPDPQTLDHLIGLLEQVFAAFRSDDARPTHCRLHLDPRLSRFAGRLAVALRQRYDVFGQPADLQRAKTLLDGTLGLTHPSAPDFPAWKLEAAVLMGYEGPDSLEQVATQLSEVAAAEPPGTSLRVRALELRGRAAWTGHLASLQAPSPSWLDVATEAFQRALAEAEPVPPEVRAGLATALLARYIERGSLDDVVSATNTMIEPGAGSVAARLLDALEPEVSRRASDLVDLGVEALRRLTGDPEARAVAERLHGLAGAVVEPASGLEPDRRLDVRISLLRAAVALDDGPALSRRSNELAVALYERFVARGNRTDLDVALDAARTAVNQPGIDKLDRATAWSSVGALLLLYYETYGDLEALSAAVAASLDAVGESGEAPPEQRVRTLSNSIAALRMRAQRLPDGEDLATARRMAEEAVSLAVGTDPETLAAALSIRASVRDDLWKRSSDLADLEAAMLDWRQVLALDAPIQRGVASLNLGMALLRLGDDGEAIEESIRLLCVAVRHLERTLPNRVYAANQLAAAVQRRALRRGSESVRSSELRRAARWSARAVRWASNSSPEAQLRVAWDWGHRAAAVEDWESAATAYGAAIGALRDLVEGNRAVSAKENWLAEGFGVATRAAQALTRCGRAEEAVMALERARGLLLLDSLSRGSQSAALAGVGFEVVASAMTQPLLYLVPAPGDGLGLLIDPAGRNVTTVELAGLSEEAVGGRARALHMAATGASANPKAWQRTLDRIGAWLGEAISPAVAALPPGRLTVVPTGALAFLPVHAARTVAGEWSFVGKHVVEYAPTALSVVTARRQPTPAGPSTVLAIVDPHPTSEPALPFAAAEAAVAVAAAGADGALLLPGTQATLDAVLEALPTHRTVHIACHGRADLFRPSASGVVLRDDAMLTVERLAGMDLSAVRLAVLSACETGVPGAGAPDEVIALGSTFFAAGVDGVISSLWQVPDLSTLILVTLLYGQPTLGQDPAAALADAQDQMRDATNVELRNRLRRMRADGRVPDAAHRLLDAELSALEPDGRDFGGTDAWAGFVFTGHTSTAL
ncbi:CHAT domain-containing protein [Blastococcus sp. CT_GayMR20]|uniref:CHAT domain-containing protein n=1 Tax=Blastococcus sp. CT_GayMR20 TaxID=2559609 RepID=UPI001073A0E8|nr:CHAT domain-containing protein [Blastococcus sp. CT_GayMR20]TFV92689.1 CHAT domain-containing protein [Blastococcus sp. CT_GayMR20]TFV92730.1 CHAT domain-containing protein [Blastococcus sp. CT_GayMR20]